MTPRDQHVLRQLRRALSAVRADVVALLDQLHPEAPAPFVIVFVDEPAADSEHEHEHEVSS